MVKAVCSGLINSGIEAQSIFSLLALNANWNSFKCADMVVDGNFYEEVEKIDSVSESLSTHFLYN